MNASCHLNPNKGIWAGQQALSRGLYTNVTECSCFSVCTDKLFKVLGMSVIVPSSTLPPFVPYFVSVALSRTLPQVQKRKNAKRLLRCSVCLISLHRMLCCKTTSRRLYCWENKAELRCRTTSDGESQLLPPFQHFTFLILPSFPPLIHFPLRSLSLLSLWVFIFDALMSPVGFLRRLIWKRKDEGTEKSKENCWASYNFCKCICIKYVPSMQLPSCFVLGWEKDILKHMVFVCSLNWINWRPMGNHQGG